MNKRPTKSDFELFHLNQSHNGQLLGSALRKLLGGVSWNQIRKLLKQRKVQVNGNLCLDDARKLTAKDVVKVWKESLPKPIEATDIRIVYLDAYLAVVEKPAGVTSVRHYEERKLSSQRRQIQPTLDELLPVAIHHFEESKLRTSRISNNSQGRHSDRHRNHPRAPRKPLEQRKLPVTKVLPVHRLDRDTSGIMLFARDRTTAVTLTRMFKKHAIDRRYLAIVEGQATAATYTSYIARDRGDGIRGSVPNEDYPLAQLAITHVRPIESVGDYSVVECRLETGRTHQIRIHLSEAGHPLLGEPIYRRNPPHSKKRSEPVSIPRHALHAYLLRFEHPVTKQPMEFMSSWPKDLQKILDQLRLESRS